MGAVDDVALPCALTRVARELNTRQFIAIMDFILIIFFS
jgi:hypothetical protein